MSNSYLLEEDDGLIMRDSQDYAKDKLRLLKGYIQQFIVSMRNNPLWRALYYIDLQAGPGKNVFTPSQSIMLGSPLLALTAKFPFTQYRFVELRAVEYNALLERISVSDRRVRVKLMRGDCNVLVDQIVEEIQEIDRPFIKGKPSSLNLAFLDPNGLELNWNTVEKLGNVKRMDLIINFSTSGFTRNVGKLIEKNQTTQIDHFFGTQEWKETYRQVEDQDNTAVRRAMLDFYKKRLAALGYIIDFEREILPDEQVFRNRRNAQVYTLIFASKHPLGTEFWQNVLKDVSQPRLF